MPTVRELRDTFGDEWILAAFEAQTDVLASLVQQAVWAGDDPERMLTVVQRLRWLGGAHDEPHPLERFTTPS